MKRTVLFVMYCCLCMPAFSQVSVGVTGGYTLSKFHTGKNEYPEYISNSFVSGWHAGIIAEKHIAGGLYLQPQLLISRKGHESFTKFVDPPEGSNKWVMNTTYLELPLNLVYKLQLGSGQLYAGAGPYVARGLGGRARLKSRIPLPDGTIHDVDSKQKIVFKSDPPLSDQEKIYLRPWDLGLNFIAGYELKNGLLLNVNYSLGLSGIYNGSSYYKNRYFGVSAGWFLFGRKK